MRNIASPTSAPRCRFRPASTRCMPRRCPRPFSPSGRTCSSAARLQAGESFLVHGGSSGIGTTAIQLAKAFGATVFTTAGSAEKCAACEKLGADVAINYRESDFVAVIKEKTGGRGVDLILDMVGGDYMQRNIAERRRGWPHSPDRLPARPESGTVDFTRLMVKRITLTGSTLRARSMEVKAAPGPRAGGQGVAAAGQGQGRAGDRQHAFRSRRPPTRIARMETNAHIGKIILTAVERAQRASVTICRARRQDYLRLCAHSAYIQSEL